MELVTLYVDKHRVQYVLKGAGRHEYGLVGTVHMELEHVNAGALLCPTAKPRKITFPWNAIFSIEDYDDYGKL